MTEQELAQKVGEAVLEQLRKPGEGTRVLTFDLWDHKRRLAICTLKDRLFGSDIGNNEDANASIVKIPDGLFLPR